MNGTLSCDWLSRSGLPAVSRKKIVVFFPCDQSFMLSSLFGRDGWILPPFYFCAFMDRDGVEVHNYAKKEVGQYLAILTSCLVNNTHIYRI